MSKRIITVDDASTMRKMISFTLKADGHDVIEAEDGVHALDVLENEIVDLVITDLNMPRMDGIELVRNLRSKAGFARTPIIILTTESEGTKKVEAKNAGATGWIVKPFKQDQLKAIVAKVLN